jgi:hypothetical protein
MSSPGHNPANGNYENIFKLSVSANGGLTWVTYTVSPRNTNSTWTNQWWDYCHMQLAGRYLYIAWNMFSEAGAWTRTVMLRWPLDALAAGAGFSYNYYQTSSWFTFVPAQGCDHTMYWASNWPMTAPQNSRIAIWKWPEDTTAITSVVRTVPAWTLTGRGAAVCGSATGNWAARYDMRVLSGARYRIWNTNLKYYGRNVLGWWWNVAQGGSFVKPYIEGAAFFEDTLALVPGLQGRPFVYNSTTCFAYPAASVNERGDVGLIFNYSSGTALNPSVALALRTTTRPLPRAGPTIPSETASFVRSTISGAITIPLVPSFPPPWSGQPRPTTCPPAATQIRASRSTSSSGASAT